MTTLFVDTGYLIALELANDQNHSKALQHWQRLKHALPPLVTTAYVFNEVVTFFNSRGHHAKAVTVGNSLLGSPSIEFVHVDESLFHAGWRYLRAHQDKRYSLTDCISFMVMEHSGITTALTFDKHFVQAGFQVLP